MPLVAALVMVLVSLAMLREEQAGRARDKQRATDALQRSKAIVRAYMEQEALLQGRRRREAATTGTTRVGSTLRCIDLCRLFFSKGIGERYPHGDSLVCIDLKNSSATIPPREVSESCVWGQGERVCLLPHIGACVLRT